jgi:hypothetical protein
MHRIQEAVDLPKHVDRHGRPSFVRLEHIRARPATKSHAHTSKDSLEQSERHKYPKIGWCATQNSEHCEEKSATNVDPPISNGLTGMQNEWDTHTHTRLTFFQSVRWEEQRIMERHQGRRQRRQWRCWWSKGREKGEDRVRAGFYTDVCVFSISAAICGVPYRQISIKVRSNLFSRWQLSSKHMIKQTHRFVFSFLRT